MGVINSPLVEGGVFSEEVNKKEVFLNLPLACIAKSIKHFEKALHETHEHRS